MGFVTAFSYMYMLTCLIYIVPCPLACFLVLSNPTSTLLTCSCGRVNFTGAAYRSTGKGLFTGAWATPFKEMPLPPH